MPIQQPQPPQETVTTLQTALPTWQGPKVVTIFEHTQTTASTEWIINHWLGRYPVVDVYIDINGEKKLAIPLNVVVDSVNRCTVYFSQPQSGIATVG